MRSPCRCRSIPTSKKKRTAVENLDIISANAGSNALEAALIDHVQTTALAGATGLELLEMGASRIQVDDKKIINCHADLNQLVPFKYEWAWKNITMRVPTIGCPTKLICLRT